MLAYLKLNDILLKFVQSPLESNATGSTPESRQFCVPKALCLPGSGNIRFQHHNLQKNHSKYLCLVPQVTRLEIQCIPETSQRGLPPRYSIHSAGCTMFWREEEEKEGNSHSVNNGDIFLKQYIFQCCNTKTCPSFSSVEIHKL